MIPLNPDFSKAQTGSMELCCGKEDKCPLGTSQLEKLKKKTNNFQLLIGPLFILKYL